MSLDVLGCTLATLMNATSLPLGPIGLGNLLKFHCDGDRSLQLLIFNEEFLISASHQLALTTSVPRRRRCEKFIKPYHLEEGEVVTRFP